MLKRERERECFIQEGNRAPVSKQMLNPAHIIDRTKAGGKGGGKGSNNIADANHPRIIGRTTPSSLDISLITMEMIQPT